MSCSLLAMRAMRCVFQISVPSGPFVRNASTMLPSFGLLRVLGQCLPERQLVEPRPQLRLCQLDDLVLRQVDRRHLVVKVE